MIYTRLLKRDMKGEGVRAVKDKLFPLGPLHASTHDQSGTEIESILYSKCIIGYVSAIPDYEIWSTGKVKVDNRIWIKIK